MTLHRNASRLLVAALALCSSYAAHADTSPATDPQSGAGAAAPAANAAGAQPASSTTSSSSLEAFAVPDAPAFTYLQTTPSEITQISAPRELLTQLANTINADGTVSQGVALTGLIWPLVGTAPLSRYKTPLGHSWSNLSFSFGTIKTSGAASNSTGSGITGSATDMAVGLYTVIIDHGDPLLSPEYLQGVADALSACLPTPPNPPPSESELDDCYKKHYDESQHIKQYNEYAKKHWNEFRVAAAGATGARLPNSEIKSTSWTGFRLWSLQSIPVGTWGQWIIYEAVSRAPADHRTDWKAGARFNFGTPTTNGFAETVVGYNGAAPSGTEPWSGQAGLGIEFRITSDTWLATSLSRDLWKPGQDPITVAALLKWTIGSSAKLDPTK